MRIISLLILTFWAFYANAQRDIYLVTTTNDLYKFNPTNCQANRIGSIQQAGGAILDIAVCPSGKMYALTLTHLHEINAGDATIMSSTYITGSIAGYSPNALTCDSQNKLYAAAFFRTNLYSINPDNGQSTDLGNMGYYSAGDLSILDENTLLLTTHANQLVRVNKADGQASLLTTINANTTIYGTISIPNQDCANANVDLIAFGGTNVYKVNSQSLEASLLCSGVTPAIVTGAASLAEFNTTQRSTKTAVDYQVCQPSLVDLTQFLQSQPGGGQFTSSQHAHLLNGSTVRFEATTPPGDYYFMYQTGSGDCRTESSIHITYSYVNIDLGEALQVCTENGKTIGVPLLPDSYTYAWNTGATTPSISVHEPGTYILTVQNKTCSYSSSVMVSTIPIQVTGFQQVVPHCTKQDGSISIIAQGGTQLSYQLNDRPSQPIARFDNLEAGPYTITIRNAEGCSMVKPVNLAATPTPVIETVSMDTPTCGQANGKVMIQAKGGTGQLWYSLDGKNYQLDHVFKNLQGGTFHACVKDQDACQTERPVEIPRSLPVQISDIQTNPATCNKANGSIKFQATGGNGNFRYGFNDQVVQQPSFTNLKAGTYTIAVVDTTGCSDTQQVTIYAIEPPAITQIAAVPTLCDQRNGEFTIQAMGSQPLMYSSDGVSFQPQASLTHLDEGTYTITVKDANNCIVSQQSTIALDCADVVYRPTGFSPNHDGVNDFFVLKFPYKQLNLIRFAVLNRWGNLVHSKENLILQSGDALWDGQIDGTDATSEVYPYVLEVIFPDGKTHRFSGSVTILK